jgi:hypothetical protein
MVQTAWQLPHPTHFFLSISIPLPSPGCEEYAKRRALRAQRNKNMITFTRPLPEGVKKSIWFFVTSFRRKPESSVFKTLRTCWTPVFTGVTAEI